jgi:hypothetical protein
MSIGSDWTFGKSKQNNSNKDNDSQPSKILGTVFSDKPMCHVHIMLCT